MTFSYKSNGDGSLDVISGSYSDKIGKWSVSGDELCFELSQDTLWDSSEQNNMIEKPCKSI